MHASIDERSPSSRIRHQRRLSFLTVLALLGVSLVIAPTTLATPATGPGAVSQATAGALAAGTIPDGTCRARATATGGGGASGPTASGLGGIGGPGASITATYAVLPLQTYQGSVGGGGGTPTGGTGNGAIGTGGTGGTVGTDHRGGGGGGRSTVDLGGSTVLIAGGGGGGGGAHNAPTTGNGGGGGIAGIGAGLVAVGSNGVNGNDTANTATGGSGGQVAAGGAGGTNSAQAARNGAAGVGIGTGTGGNGGPDANYDSGGGGGGGYTGGGGGAATVNQTVTGAGGGGGSSWVSATSPTVAAPAPTSISGVAGTVSPIVAGVGATGSVAIDWLPCLYSLSISKSVSSATVNAGGSVIWTVAVTNTGPDSMTRGDTVDLADTLPAGPNGSPAPAYRVLTIGTSGGTNANMSRGAVTCTGVAVGSSMPASTVCSRAYSAPSAPQAPAGGTRGLDPGETLTITYEQIIANTAPCATITNTATTTDRATQTGTTDIVGVSATRTANASLTIACYDLGITKVASPKPGVRPGGTVTWTITVTNNGPGAMVGPVATDANPLVVTDTFPSTGVGTPVLVSSVGPAGACTRSGSTITCPSGLPAGGVQVLTFTQSVNAGATNGTVISNTATVSDPRTGDTNDSSTDSTTVRIPGLTLDKTGGPATYASVGTVINYSYLVTNSGTLGLAAPVTVADNRVTVTCPLVSSVGNLDSVFDPGESMTCTASHAITQADLDAGSITNTATATADAVNSNSDAVTVTAVQTRALTLVKSALPTTFNAVGQVISYSYLVTNSGNVTLAGPFTVSDNQASNESCPVTATLAPGASITCTASDTITQADLDLGSLTNVASVSNATTTSPTDTETVNAVQTRALALVKSALPTTFNAVGQVISYSYLVTNTGNVTLAGPFTVSDNQAANESCPVTATLAPGASITCTASDTITQADLDLGSLTNIASVSNGTTTSPTDTETVNAVQTRALTLVKSALPTTFNAVGQVISYSYLVTNTGNVTLTGPFTVGDNQAANESCPVTATLAPGASITCTASDTITQADLDLGSLTNIASVSNATTTSPTDTETVTAVQTRSLSLVKSALPTTFNTVGQTISYSYLVTNTGNVTLSGPFTVSDNQAANESCPATATLAPGASITCTASDTISQADLDAGSLTNIASVSNGTTTSPTDTETVTAAQGPALTLVKTAAPLTYVAVGEVISYGYLVTNSGNVTLAGPFSVSDDQVTVLCPSTSSLAPGASISCTASHTIDQADIDAGSITNTASASNAAVTSNTDTETVTAIQNPALTMVKTATPGTYDAVGDTIDYEYLVTNTGNVTLTSPLTVVDDKVTVTCPVGDLAPSASLTCTASYVITQTDLDAGSVTNTATASADGTDSDQDSETVTAAQGPALSLVKTAAPTTYVAVGEVISYDYLVTNTGNVTIGGTFTVTDDQVSVSCPATPPLAPGDSVTCTASHTIDQADLDAGFITNVASATNGAVTSNADTETVTAIQNPAMALVKTALPTTYSSVGDVIDYEYLVTNTGNVTLTGPVTVADDKATVSCPPGDLAPSASATCTASYVVTQADLDSGSVTNTATATADGIDSNSDSETVTAVQDPELTLIKTAFPTTYDSVGDTIDYEYLVTNTGNVTLAGPVAVVDDKAAVSCATGDLAPGGSVTCTASYVITQLDLDAGTVSNTATASADDTDSNTDSETVTADQNPALTLVKTATPSTYSTVGDTIDYEYLVTNTGNVTLTGPVTVADDKATVSCPAGDLAPGASTTCTASYVATQVDLDTGSVTNTATASADGTDSNQDAETATAVQAPALNLVKTATPGTYDSVGDTIDYDYLVTNTGNVTLTGPVTVIDDKATVTCPAGDLAPGGSTTCTANYAITQLDLDNGSVTNTATASADGTDSNADSETVTAVETPGLSLVKTATPGTYSSVGDVIDYEYLVTNTGNVTLTGPITVADDKATVSCPAGDLAPGDDVTCTASYAITQIDLDVGSVTNTATARVDGIDSNQDAETVTAIQSPALSLVKTATPSTYDSVGDVIDYEYLVTNTGNVTLSGPVTVVDDKATVSCPAGDLAPGDDVTCTASYSVTQLDLDSGSITNTATASADGIDSNQDSETVTAVQDPSLDLVKSAAPMTYIAVGEVITYDYVITNDGNVALGGTFTVDDDRVSVSCPATPPLAPGSSITCTASHTIDQADLDAGSITNTASASNGTVTSNTDTEIVTAIPAPGLALVKTATPSTYDSVGDVIGYSYLVTNTGNVTLGGTFTITDDQATNETCPLTAPLAPGASITCTASDTITQADLDAGSLTNTATASNGTVTSNSDSETVTAVQTAGLSLVKTATPTTYDSVGDVIDYEYLVTNTGNVTLSGPVTVADDKATVTCPAGDLAPGDDVTCTASYLVSQLDLDTGFVTNTATASADGTDSNADTETVTAVQAPALALVKTATPGTYDSVGDVIDYDYLVTNTGNVTLTGPVTVVDDKVTVSCPAGDLAPGDDVTCTASYVITQPDLDAGSVTNTATASADGSDSNQDSATVTAIQDPSLSLVKTATPTTYDSVGDTIDYDYLVTNTGNVTLSGPVTVADDKATVSCPAGDLAPGASTTCTASYVITQLDLDAGAVTNIATASADGTDSNTDTETVTATQDPSLALVKTATPGTYNVVGNVIDYAYLVTNTGNVTLTGPVTVVDDKATVSCPAGDLAPGASITCTASYVITQLDLDDGSVTNVATASADGIDSNQDSETVTAAQGPALALVKTATPSTYAAVGDVIDYEYVVTNSGNVTLTGGFSVSDDQVAVTCPPTGSLLVGASITCTASYTVTQADLDNGSITNIASATNGTITSPTDNETVTAAQGPALTLVKTATPSTYAAVGDVIDYDYLVTNTGNVTLDGPVTVADDKVAVSCPAVASLDPGDDVTCTASYTITQLDIDAGSVTNTASASADGVTSPDDSETVTAAQGPDLELVKTATPSTYAAVGDVIDYEYLVTNIGNVTLDGPVTVADDKVTVTCPSVVSLDPGEDVTCTASHTITQADLDDGSITNIASATADSVTSATDSETVTAAQGPALSLAKSATPTTYDSVGDVIAYEYLVTNTGNVSLDGPVTVADDKVTVTCPSTGTLDPGDDVTCTASHTITQADLDDGSITNTASASADGVTSNEDSVTVTGAQGPGLSLAKTASPMTYNSVGDVTAYEYLVTNTGNVSLDGPVTVADDKVTVTCPSVGTLDPGEDVTCTASHTITQADLDDGSITNTASASADGTTSNDDSVTVTASQGPGLSIAKSASPTTFAAVGDVIDYSYVVTNTGNVSLDGPVTVTDDKVSVTCPSVATLDPGDSVTCAASYSIVQSDIDAGSITNVASAAADGVDSSTDTVTVTDGAPSSPAASSIPATRIPTPPPTDTAPDGLASPAGAIDLVIAVWVVLISLAAMFGGLAPWHRSRRRRRNASRD